jgi:hypothetical protein
MKAKQFFFYGTTFVAVTLLVAAGQINAQNKQPFYCPGNTKAMVVYQQTQTTNYTKAMQQQTQYDQICKQQAQSQLMQMNQQQTQKTAKSAMTTQSSMVPMQKTVTSFAPQTTQQMTSKFDTISKTQSFAPMHTGTGMGKTTPWSFTTQQLVHSTDTATSTTMKPTQCTHSMMQAQQQHSQQTATATNTKQTQLQKTMTAMQRTDQLVKKTDQKSTWTPVTTTQTTATVQLVADQQCNKCHHQQPSMVAKQPHEIRQPIMPLPAKLPPLVQQANANPLWLPRPLETIAAPPLFGPPAFQPPLMVRKPAIPLLPVPTYQPQPVPTLVAKLQLVPSLRDGDLPAFLRKSESKPVAKTMDPTLVATAGKSTPGSLPTLIDTNGMEMPVRTPTALTQDTLSPTTVDEVKTEKLPPLPEQDLQQPPPRKLSAAVVQLPQATVKTVEVVTEDTEALPPGVTRRALDFDSPTALPTATDAAPQPAPAVQDLGAPTPRKTKMN